MVLRHSYLSYLLIPSCPHQRIPVRSGMYRNLRFHGEGRLLIYYSVFFIQLDCFGKLWEWDIGFYRKFISFQDFSDVLGFAFFGESFLFNDLCDLVHSDGYSFTVAFSFIVEVLLNGMGKGMSEVQENPLSVSNSSSSTTRRLISTQVAITSVKCSFRFS